MILRISSDIVDFRMLDTYKKSNRQMRKSSVCLLLYIKGLITGHLKLKLLRFDNVKAFPTNTSSYDANFFLTSQTQPIEDYGRVH